MAMKKIRFVMDFQGSETRNIFYERDTEHIVDDGLAALMVKDERAIYVLDEKPKPIVEPVEKYSPANDFEISGAEYDPKPRKRTRKNEKISY
jgi:hypothetical protein